MSASQTDPVRVGIIGLGRSGWDIHSRTLGAMPQKYKIVAAADPLRDRADEAVAKFGCRGYDGAEALVKDKDIELVVVASTSNLHPPHAILGLDAGKHAVCEKPLAVTVADVDRMIAAAKKAGRTLAPFQNRRYGEEFKKIRDTIKSGKIGRALLIRIAWHRFSRRWDWQTLREFNGGEISNNAPHFIDMALQLFGAAEPKVFCQALHTVTAGDAEDHIKVILSGPNAPLIDIEMSWSSAFAQDVWFVMGTSGGIAGTERELKIRSADLSAIPAPALIRDPMPKRGYPMEKIPWVEESWTRPPELPSNMTQFYDSLYETLRNGAPLAITPESVRRVVSVIEQCRQMTGFA